MNNKSVVGFLKRWSPNGYWVLTAIDPETGDIRTQTFTQETEEECLRWVGTYNGRANLYFSVNQPLGPLSKKAERADIARVEWFHVDIDPRPGAAIKEEQSKALLSLTSQRPQGIPRPSCIIFSGGGYQAFWKLKTPIEINGDLEQAEQAKLYNMQLERVFKGDKCHNIDRIMRLPYTMNIPNAAKVKKGRKPVVADLLELEPETVYELSDFLKAQKVSEKGGGTVSGVAPKLEISGNIPRIEDVEELSKWNVPERTKVLIVQGTETDEEIIAKKTKEGKDVSRSAWLLEVVCSLVRCEVPNDIIYSIITDKNFAISDSVYAQKDVDRYAKRQIERALDFAVDPDLAKFNEEYCFIEQFGNKARVVSRSKHPVSGIMELHPTDLQSFRATYNNKKKEWMEIDPKSGDPKPITRPLGDWWLTHPKRRTCKRVVFAPGQELLNCYNLWDGFACAAIPGDCSKFLTHLKENVCSGVEEHYEYFLNWAARMFQQPAEPGEVAVVFRGARGVGKGFVARMLGYLLGPHYQPVSDAKHIVGTFNAHLRSCILLFADEAFYAGDRKHEANLKTLITEKMRSIEAKGVDVEQAPNFIHLIMASNEKWVVPAGEFERRFFVLDVASHQMQNRPYFASIEHQLLNEGGKEALLHLLLTRDISKFNVGNVPQTKALQEQKDESLKPTEIWWLDKLTDGELILNSGEWPEKIGKSFLWDDYVEFCDKSRVTSYDRLKSKQALSIFLSEITGADTTRSDIFLPRRGGKLVRAYELPNLVACRNFWDKKKGPRDWAAPVDPDTIIKEDEIEENLPF